MCPPGVDELSLAFGEARDFGIPRGRRQTGCGGQLLQESDGVLEIRGDQHRLQGAAARCSPPTRDVGLRMDDIRVAVREPLRQPGNPAIALVVAPVTGAVKFGLLQMGGNSRRTNLSQKPFGLAPPPVGISKTAGPKAASMRSDSRGAGRVLALSIPNRLKRAPCSHKTRWATS